MVIHKLYCTNPHCIWLTDDHICSWTSCPENNRLSFTGDIEQYKEFLKKNKPPEPVVQLPVTLKPVKPRRHGGGRPPKPVVGKDANGVHPFPSCAAADDAFGFSSGTVSNAIFKHHKAGGLVWGWANVRNSV